MPAIPWEEFAFSWATGRLYIAEVITLAVIHCSRVQGPL